MTNEQTELARVSLPTVAELALSGKRLPLLTRAVVVGESVRRAALAMHRVPSMTLAGKDASGKPLIQQHRHAHYIADCRLGMREAMDEALRITHVVVYAPAGLLPSEVAALLAVRDLPPFVVGDPGESGPLSVTLCGLGQVAGLTGSSLGQKSRVFSSRTPFVLPRHRKRGDEPEDQLVRELRLRGLPAPIHIARTTGLLTPSQPLLPWSQFVISRRHDEVTTGYYGFRIEFAEPVEGPLLLGYGCHYGLGQFVAAPDTDPPDGRPLP
jgi:CRISPR-associated protein Csb2